MNRRVVLHLVPWAMLGLLGGCNDYRPAPLPTESAPTVTSPTTPVPKAPPVPPPTVPPPTVPPPTAPLPTAPKAPAQPAPLSVRLSSGVAMAQPGPEGTMMGFSIDYQAAGGSRASAATYRWVLERSHGEPIRVETRLQRSGTLQTFVPWRPEDGPFKTHLEDAQGTVLTESLELR